MINVSTWVECIERKGGWGKESGDTYGVVNVRADDETFLSSI